MAGRVSFEERLRIEAWVSVGLGDGEIASRLGRCARTISRERSRCSGGYVADEAQADADRKALRPRVGKLVGDPVLAGRVRERLERGWSPVAVAVDLARLGGARVCAETIYQSVYRSDGGGLGSDAWELLVRRRRCRRPQGWRQRHALAGPLRAAKTIRERPQVVEERSRVGDWEADLLVCDRNQATVLVAVERHTRLTLLRPLENPYDSRTVGRGLVRMLKPIPKQMLRTLTLDRGGEMSAWRIMEQGLGIDVYYCDPQAPQQKGSCEHTNGMLRRAQWLPRHLTAHQIQTRTRWVQHQINTMPRKLLNNQPPLLIYAQALNQDNHH